MTDNDHYYRQYRLLSALFSCSVVVYWVTIASMQRLINTGKVWGSFLLICYCSILSNGHYTASMGYFEVNSHTIAGRVFFVCFFLSFWLLSVRRDHSFLSSPPQCPMISDFEGFLSQILSITFFCPIFILQKEPVFPF